MLCIWLVSRASFSQDLQRLRQGREDTPHDQDLLNRVLRLFTSHATSQEDAHKLAKRLFVRMLDVEETISRDVQVALYILRSHILLDEKQDWSAWDTLVQAGHDLVESRGRYEASDLVRLLQSRKISLSESLLPVVKNRYMEWLLAYTSTFSIPGPCFETLPIDTAWTELHVLSRQNGTTEQDVEAQLACYHEWESLASRTYEDGYSAKDVAAIGYRVIIVGGPGAGKSTLSRKVTHDLTALEELVMWVHLPDVISRHRSGININTALVDTATDGFDAPLAAREALFAEVDCLIADGLDECGSSIMTMVEALQRWASARPSTRIVIMTRPVGYESKFFPDWEHYELLPLTKMQVERTSQQIITALAPNTPMTIGEKVGRFQVQLEGSWIASLANRSPLLLGFLIQLSLADISLAQQRASLYEQILDLWRVSLPQGQEWQIAQLDAILAWRSLELLGWFFIFPENGQITRTHDQLVRRLSQQLAHEMDIQPLQASAKVNICLQFWHERGVLDCLRIGHKEVYTFVHQTFGEYAAGRYLASLEAADIQQWVQNKCNDARWREPLLLAAGSGAAEVIVETLLTIDESDQATLALLLAAAALAEAPLSADTLATSVVERLMDCLVSSEPSVAYDAAEQGAGLAARRPDLFAPHLQSLFQHPQQWTRLSAMYLVLVAGDMCIDIERLETFLDDLCVAPTAIKRGRWVFTSEWDMHNEVVVLGAEALARLCPNAATKERLQTIYDCHSISIGTQEKLRRILFNLGHYAFIEEREKGEVERILNRFARGDQRDQKILETILRLTSSPFTSGKKRRKLKALALLIYALRVPKSDVRHWDVLNRLDDVKAIEAVLSGYIAALQLNKEELAEDAAWALAELHRMSQSGVVHTSLLSLLPKFPVSPEIHVVDYIDIRVQDLIRALQHPSAIIGRGAAQLLARAGKGKEEIASLLLTSNDGQLLGIIAEIAALLWGIEARPLLIKRLEQGYTLGSNWLIEELPHLAGDHRDQQFQRVLLDALKADDPYITINAVHALEELDILLLRDMTSELQTALVYWAKRGEGGKAKTFYVAHDCSTCRIAPGNAHAHVAQLLSRL